MDTVMLSWSLQSLPVQSREQQNDVEQDLIRTYERPPQLDKRATGVEREGAEGEGGEVVC